MKKFFLGCGIFIICACSFGCSWFMLNNTGGDITKGIPPKFVITGRTMDEWSDKDVATKMIAVPKGTSQRVPTVYKNEPETNPTKYSYIGVDAFQDNIIVEGLNSCGLGVSITRGLCVYFPALKDGDIAIDLNNLASWILGNFKSVDDVKAALEKTVVTYGKGPITMNFAITDKNGKSIIVEFLSGECKIYANPMPIMTSNYNPSISFFITYYDRLSNIEPYFLGDSSSSSSGIFIKLAFANKFMTASKTAEEGIENAIVLLDHAKISNGECIKYGVPIRTVWSVIKDHNNLRIYYSTEADNDYHYVSFDDDGKGIFSGGVKKFSIFKNPEHKCENNSFQNTLFLLK